MNALRRMDGGGSPEGPERSEGAAQRLDASTAVRHPDSVPPNLTRQPSNNPITAPSDTGSALNNPVYAFAPVEDPDAGVWQIRIVVDGMDVTIGTSLVVLGVDQAMTVADRLNRPLGWTRQSWTAFAGARP